jgi:hypothetical protein
MVKATDLNGLEISSEFGLVVQGAIQQLLAATPDNVDFGVNETLDQESEQIQLQNIGSNGFPNVSISKIQLEGTHANQFSLNLSGLDNNLGLGEGTNFTVNFNPTTSGVKQASIMVYNNYSNDPLEIPVTGALNLVPVANNQQLTTSEDTQLNLTLSGNDPEGANLSFSFSQPKYGTLTGTAPNLVYTPALNFNNNSFGEPDSFEFTVSDGISTSVPATIEISVTPVNDQPSFQIANTQITNPDLGSQLIVAFAFNIEDGDPELDESLSFGVQTNAPQLFSALPLVTDQGDLSYTPATGVSGIADVIITLNDGGATNNTSAKSFKISINPLVTVDNDGDGFDSTVDCNDNNPNIYPGAPEICDGADNDCDGNVDEGLNCNPDPTFAVRINAGGPQVNAFGETFAADTYFSGGKTYTNPNVTAIEGTTFDQLYLTERSSATKQFAYNIPVPNGQYLLKLHFAEIYWQTNSNGTPAGNRVFSVTLEGQPLAGLSNYDPVADVGSKTAAVKEYTVNITDGTLNLNFTASVDEPKISGLEVIGIQPNQLPVANAGPDQILTLAAGSSTIPVTLNGAASNDSDGTISSYSWSLNGSQIATGVNPTVNLPQAIHDITLTVTDDDNASANDQVIITVNPAEVACALPSPWLNGDIGAVGAAGEACFENGIFTIKASGADIWSTTDEFHYVYRTLSGDGEIIARVTSLSQTNNWAKAGVMVRNTLAPNSKVAHMLMAANPTNGGPGYSFQLRTTDGGNMSQVGPVNSGLPYFVRIVRAGNILTGFVSTTNGNWQQVGQTTMTLNQQVFVGLAVTSHNDGVLTTATFDNVQYLPANVPNQLPVANAGPDQILTLAAGSSTIPVTLNGAASNDSDGTINSYSWSLNGSQIATGVNPTVNLPQGIHDITLAVTDDDNASANDQVVITVNPAEVACALPSPWLNSDIGAVGAAGEACFENGVFTIKASGADIWGTNDEFHYVYRTLNGDGELIARVTSLNQTNEWAKAGVLLRNTLATNSKQVHMLMAANPDNEGSGYSYQVRQNDGASMTYTLPVNTSLPYFVRLVRFGNTVTGFVSATNGNWQQVSQTNLTLNQQVYIGLAVTSHNDGVLTTATFDNVQFQQTGANQLPVADAGTDITVIDTNNNGTEQVTLNASESFDPDGSLINYTWTLNGQQIASGVTAVIAPPVGVHLITLTVTDNNFATDTDVVVVTVNPPVLADASIWLEAECGVVGSGWQTLNDASASNGKYLNWPTGTASNTPPSDIPANKVTFNFNVSQAGSYYLFARIRAASGNDDSFWIRVNNGSWIKWWEGIIQGNNFNWNQATGSPFNLVSGNNVIDFAWREDGTHLDKIVVKTTANLPVNIGDEATNCSDSPVACTLPNGWLNQDIGNVAAQGSVCFNNGTFEVKGSGNDIYNTADEFHFVYYPLNGDGEITARVNSLTKTHEWAKSGVMLREKLIPGSKMAIMIAAPDPALNGSAGYSFQYRSGENQNVGSNYTLPVNINLPHYVRLVRSGSTFSGFVSANGINWTLVSQTTISMTTTIYAGLAVSSHNDGQIATSLIDMVSLISYNSGNLMTFEAETAVTSSTSAFRIAGDNEASNQEYAMFSELGRSEKTDLTNTLEFSFDLQEGGNYEIQGVFKGNLSTNNPLWMKVNRNSWKSNHDKQQNLDGFNWKKLPLGTYRLESGANLIKVAYQNRNLQFDKLELVLVEQEIDESENKTDLANLVEIYPVPVKNSLMLQLKAPVENLDVYITSMSGVRFEGILPVDEGGNRYKLDISRLSAGMYILTLQTGEISYHQRFVKVD